MKITLFLGLLTTLFLAQTSIAQQTYMVDGFSTAYYGKVYLEQPDEVFSKGWVAIYDRKSTKLLIKVESDELAISLHEGKVVANIQQLPYGEQSVIQYLDVNFDGIKDFAIEDGQNSCYHGPSFQIYLATAQGFEQDDAFTALGQEYCGMFEVDEKAKRLHTMTKDGCCWHQYSEFIVKDNAPVPIKIIEEDAKKLPVIVHTEENWDGKKMVKTTKRIVDLTYEEIEVLFSFTLEKSLKKVLICSSLGSQLNYVLLKPDDTVEFAYPADAADENTDFAFSVDKQQRTLVFRNKNAIYTVYDLDTPASKRVGIDVQADGKTYHLIGQVSSRKGSLQAVGKGSWENVKTTSSTH